MARHFANQEEIQKVYPKMPVSERWIHYKEVIRPNVKSGDLIFASGSFLASKIVQWKTKNAISHVGIVIRFDEIGRVFVLESIEEKGVRMIPLSKFLYDYMGDDKPYKGRVLLARHKDLNIENFPKIVDFAANKLTYSYDNKEYLQILWRLIRGHGKLDHNRAYTCSELVHDCFQAANIRLFYSKGFYISPGDLWENEDVHEWGVMV